MFVGARALSTGNLRFPGDRLGDWPGGRFGGGVHDGRDIISNPFVSNFFMFLKPNEKMGHSLIDKSFQVVFCVILARSNWGKSENNLIS